LKLKGLFNLLKEKCAAHRPTYDKLLKIFRTKSLRAKDQPCMWPSLSNANDNLQVYNGNEVNFILIFLYKSILGFHCALQERVKDASKDDD
jgi:hypothetical protein